MSVLNFNPDKQATIEQESLFGNFNPAPDFKPLIPLCECDEEQLKPIVDGLIYVDQLHLLHGEKNTFKSWLAGYIAVCVSLGGLCFGRTVTQGRVVYIYGEGAMKKRLKRMSKAMRCENNTNIFPYSLRADLTNNNVMQDLKNHIPPDTKLIVIDNYEKYWSSDVEDKIVFAALGFILELKEKVAVLLIQHDTKVGNKRRAAFYGSRGSGKIPNFADVVLSLTRVKGKDYINCALYLREAEEPKPFQFVLSEPEKGGPITLELANCGVLDEMQVVEMPRKRLEQVREILREKMNQPMCKTNIYNNFLKGQGIGGLSSEAFFNEVVPALVAEGSLKEDRGKYEFVDITSKLSEASPKS